MIVTADPAEAQELKQAGEELVPFIAEDDEGMPELRWRTWTRRERQIDRKAQKSKNRRGRKNPVQMYQPRYQDKRQQQRGKALTFAGTVKQRRQTLGLTQQALADAAGISRVYLAYIEGGQRLAYKPTTRQKILGALQQAQVDRVRRFAANLNHPFGVAA